MEEEFRFEIDKFEMLTHQLSDAICLYFQQAHPTTVVNLVHACNTLTKDIANFYARGGKIRKIKFFSNKSVFNAVSDQPAFNRSLGNFVKHADKDPQSAEIVTNQLVTPYLIAAVLDFQQLKKSLQGSNLIGVTTQQLETPQQSVLTKIFRAMAFPSNIMRSFEYEGPRIDILSSLFLDWCNATATNDLHASHTSSELEWKKSFLTDWMIKRVKADESKRPDICAAQKEERTRLKTKPYMARELGLRGVASFGDWRDRYYLRSVQIDGEEEVETLPPSIMSVPIFSFSDQRPQ